MIRHRTILCGALILALWTPLTAQGQVLRLAQQETGAVEVEATPGDTLSINVVADLGSQSASGLRFFVRVPREDFKILPAAAAPVAVLPFTQGQLFDGALEVRNEILSRTDPATLDENWQMMEYAALLGPRPHRARSGSGVVASFRLVCPPTPTHGTIAIHQDPIHETRLVLADGRTEKAFLLGAPLSIDVDTQTAIEPGTWAQIKIHVR